MKKLNGLVSHETWASLIGMIYLGLIVNLLLVVSSLPLVVLLVTTDPLYSWPLLAIAAPLAAPGLAAAFRAFREHGEGGLGPIRAFVAGLRATWRRALLIGVAVAAVVVVLLVDVRMLSNTAAAVFTVPLLGVLALLAIAVGLVALVAIAEVPTARLRDVLRASVYLSLRRWYLTAASLAALAAQVAVFATAPALGLGLTASAALFFAWTNSRFTLRPVLDLDEKAAAQA
ncbi:putative membrane protein YesL [Microbacterium trichothecenolyticum]|uniref:ferredoxin-NADPH reductase n=1 Tax=Microbacterium trichothecenolyticum TaxID=69370 RepID=UPI002860DDC7|nr:ferredoxin-NADPH reductase [Microbacterium trichothecenolyticum]MDR7184044.1 putative membrane protein YesL [Microbacterium trichothecenolyticum]